MILPQLLPQSACEKQHWYTDHDLYLFTACSNVESSKLLQVDIREYYEKGGELLPGKKGIALDLAQWDRLVAAVPDINAAVKEQGGNAGQAQAASGLSQEVVLPIVTTQA